jgi:hypothetical protein
MGVNMQHWHEDKWTGFMLIAIAAIALSMLTGCEPDEDCDEPHLTAEEMQREAGDVSIGNGSTVGKIDTINGHVTLGENVQAGDINTAAAPTE